MYKLLYKDGTIKNTSDPETTREDLIKWINEANTHEQRNKRKHLLFFKLHSFSQPLSYLIKKK